MFLHVVISYSVPIIRVLSRKTAAEIPNSLSTRRRNEVQVYRIHSEESIAAACKTRPSRIRDFELIETLRIRDFELVEMLGFCSQHKTFSQSDYFINSVAFIHNNPKPCSGQSC